jgi:thioredoxin-like negative regulator of GroEL
LKEIEPSDLRMDMTKKKSAVFFHTPLCGTCKVGKRMLEIVEATIADLEIASCNINSAPHIALQYNIESVPCLIVFEDGAIKEKVYAFQSVDYLYNLLRVESR